MRVSTIFSMIQRRWWVIVFFGCFLCAESVLAAPACGDLASSYGPFDYTNPKHIKENLPIVEQYHFTPEVEHLIRGKSSYIWSDLDYTLATFPNHHRALYAFVRYEIRERRKSQEKKESYKPPTAAGGYPASAECLLDRAIRWRPNDPTVRLIYGLYLHLSGDLQKALTAYKLSEQLQPNSADLQYNLGLLYFDMKQYALAKEHAKRAYQLGYPLPGLRKKLVSVGQWP